MARRLFDFKCNLGHTTEKFIDADCTVVPCPTCGSDALRQISAHKVPLGVLGPNWATDRAKKQAKEKN